MTEGQQGYKKHL